MKCSVPAALAVLLLVSCASGQEYRIVEFERQQLSDEFYSEGATMGDLNRDGKTDVVSGPFWYEGPDFRKRHAYYPPKPFDKGGYSDNFFSYVEDLNRDGWNDIVVIGFPGQDMSWFENPKGKEGNWRRHKVVDDVGTESPDYVDIVGDRAPELVCAHGEKLGWAAPDPADPAKPWVFHPVTPKRGYHKFTHGLGVGDVNGDGRKDLLEANGWWEQPASLDGDPVWKFHQVAFQKAGAQLYAYDIDGDGDNDVITSLVAHGYGLAWYEHYKEGGEIRFRRHLIMGEKPEENRYGVKWSQLHALRPTDVDRDGLTDLAVGKRHFAHGGRDPEGHGPAVIWWFRLTRTPEGVDFIPFLIDDNSGAGTQLVAGDLNADGNPDFVIGNKLGTFVLINRSRIVPKEEWEKSLPKPR